MNAMVCLRLSLLLSALGMLAIGGCRPSFESSASSGTQSRPGATDADPQRAATASPARTGASAQIGKDSGGSQIVSTIDGVSLIATLDSVTFYVGRSRDGSSVYTGTGITGRLRNQSAEPVSLKPSTISALMSRIRLLSLDTDSFEVVPLVAVGVAPQWSDDPIVIDASGERSFSTRIIMVPESTDVDPAMRTFASEYRYSFDFENLRRNELPLVSAPEGGVVRVLVNTDRSKPKRLPQP